MKRVKKTIYYLLGFTALLFAIMVIINLPVFDEDLLPEVVAIKNIEAQPFSEKDALPAIIAINGASGPNLKMATKKVREFMNKKIKQSGKDYLTDEEYQVLVGSGYDDSWRNSYLSCNSRTDTTCMEQLFTEVKNNRITDLRLIGQLSRYHDLIGIPDFSDLKQLDMEAPLTRFTLIMTLKRIYLSNAYVTESSVSFLEAAYRDSRFWRMILANSNLLITKMVAVSSYRDTLGVFSAAVKEGHFNPTELDQLSANLKLLTPEESDMSRVFDYEFKYSVDWYENAVQGSESVLSGLIDFYQPKATVNTYFKHVTLPLKKAVDLDAKSLSEYLKSEQATKDFELPFSWAPSTLYNPSGKSLIGYTIPAYTDYIGRVHDLNGMIHLLQLQTELALNPDLPAQQVIKKSKWINPYTLKPMSYDEGAGRIFFECMDKTSSCELFL